MLDTDTWSIVESYLDFEELVVVGSSRAFELYNPNKHTWNWAVKNGHLEVVKWLHFNRTKGCTADIVIL
jgi:hypothetical protein